LFFTAKNTKILFKIALKNTKFAKLNQYKALRTLPFIKAKRKKLSALCGKFFSKVFEVNIVIVFYRKEHKDFI